MIPVPIQILKKDNIQITDLETLRIIEIEITPTIETETIQMIEIIKTKITDHEVIQTTDETIKDQIIIIITIDRTTLHKTEIQIIKIDREIIANHHKGNIHVIKICNSTIEVVHLNIKDK